MAKKQQVVVIHGGEAYSNYEDFLKCLRTCPLDYPPMERPRGWKSMLPETLGNTYEVILPSMPNKHNAKYEEWKIWFERHFEILHNDVILLGHSQGGLFLAKYLTEKKPPFTVEALFLVAAAIGSDGLDGEDGGDFVFEIQKLPEIGEKIEHIFIFHSKDDPVVPYVHALQYKRALPGAKLVTFEDKGHFLIEEFPELVDSIRALG